MVLVIEFSDKLFRFSPGCGGSRYDRPTHAVLSVELLHFGGDGLGPSPTRRGYPAKYGAERVISGGLLGWRTWSWRFVMGEGLHLDIDPVDEGIVEEAGSIGSRLGIKLYNCLLGS